MGKWTPVRFVVGMVTVLMLTLFAAGCTQKVEREAPSGSAPPSGEKGTVQPGTINKAPTTD
jgi:hypothetical protein